MNKIFIIIFTLLLLLSCGEYQKVLKSTDYQYKYAKAVSYYELEDYNKALPLFDELSRILRGTIKMEQVSYYLAYCHYANGENLIAAYLFKNFSQNYPSSKYVEECSYMAAYCYYLEAPEFSLDATYNYKAIKELQAFVNRFPDSDRIGKCNQLLDELRSILSNKAFQNAKQYFLTENYKAAIIDLGNVLIDFPSCKNREEAHYLIVKSSYLLAINSISNKVLDRLNSTLDAYDKFKNTYPSSKYLKELEITYNKTQNTLIEIKKNNNEI